MDKGDGEERLARWRERPEQRPAGVEEREVARGLYLPHG